MHASSLPTPVLQPTIEPIALAHLGVAAFAFGVSMVPLIGLDYKDSRPQALAWLGGHGNPYEASLFDESGRVGIDFGVYGVPKTFVIDRRGIVRFKVIGPLTAATIAARIVPLLKELDA